MSDIFSIHITPEENNIEIIAEETEIVIEEASEDSQILQVAPADRGCRVARGIGGYILLGGDKCGRQAQH